MSRDYRLYLKDMRASCQKITRYTAGMGFEDFVGDEKTYDAVLRNLEIIGEASKRISPEVRSQAPDIEWRKISGLRDVVAHAYFGVDDAIVWDVVRNKVPDLLSALDALLARERNS